MTEQQKSFWQKREVWVIGGFLATLVTLVFGLDSLEILVSSVLAIGGTYIFYRQLEYKKQSVDIVRKTQTSDQFTKAMDLLSKPSVEARVGGMYSLESLAHADPDGYGVQVMKTLVAYSRNNAANERKKALDKPNEPEKRDKPSPLGEDVKTAFAVLKRLYDEHGQRLMDKSQLHRWFDGKPDDLSFAEVDFRMLDLRGIEWIDRVDMYDAKLQGADLQGAKLQGADLQGAKLQGADLFRSQLQGACLRWAFVQGANLQEAQLHGAALQYAFLKGTHLQRAYLQGADLQWAHVQGANLQGAQLHGADLRDSELDFGLWYDAVIETDEKKLKDILKKAGLKQETIETIIKRFQDAGGSKSLWKPQLLSAHIFCDDDFAPLKYEYKKPDENITRQCNLNDKNKDWQDDWEKILTGFADSSNFIDFIDFDFRFFTVKGLITNFVFNFLGFQKEDTPCTQGLRAAIRSLDDYKDIYAKLHPYYQRWLDKDDT